MKLLNTYDCHTITTKGSSQSAAALMRWKPVLQRLPPQPQTEPGLKARFFHYWVVVDWGVSNVMIRSSFFCTVAGLWNRIPALVRLANSLFGVNLLFGQAGARPHRYADFEWPLCGSVFGVKHEATCAGGPRWSKSSTRTMVSKIHLATCSCFGSLLRAYEIFTLWWSFPLKELLYSSFRAHTAHLQ